MSAIKKSFTYSEVHHLTVPKMYADLVFSFYIKILNIANGTDVKILQENVSKTAWDFAKCLPDS